MKTHALRWVSVVVLLCGFGLGATSRALAQDGQEEDPPGRVARLSLTTGEVSFSPAGTDDWVSAVVNRPLTTGDKLWTDQDARAELHVGSAAFRISSMTGFSFLNLTDRMIQVRLTEGTMSFRVRRMADDESIEIDTPNLAFSPLKPGHYRINVNEAGDTTIINVEDGQGEVTGGGSAYTIRSGEQAFLTGTDTLSADVGPLADQDEFDQWCNERDLRQEHAASRRYVSDDVIGYEDLDDYGGWRPTPEYGTIWFPHVTVVNWAPYRYGHWAWISPWGWTWVDDAPWGFAPFHYGRWVSVRGAWGWVPCPPPVVAVAYVRPVYAPALVAWVGGPHFGVGVGVGAGVGVGVNVGWFPLGPREVYVPTYHVSRAYVTNVNISNTTVNQTVINNYYETTVVNRNVAVNNVRYVNQGVVGGVTATSGQNFTSARPVGANQVKFDQREVAAAPVSYGAPSIAPPKQAVLGSGAATNHHPPVAVMNRAVVAKVAPPPPPASFARQQAAIQANEGRPISVAQARQLAPEPTRANVAAVKIAPAARAVTPVVNNSPGPLNRTNQPGPNGPAARPAAANPSANAPGASREPGPLNRPAGTNANAPAVNPNAAGNSNRPPSARSNAAPAVDPQLEERHQQQIQQLQQKQDQERQKLDDKRYQQQQQLQKQPNAEQKQPQVEQKQQQQLQQLEQKHDQEQQQLKQRQEADHARSQNKPEAKPKSEEKDKDKEKDKPHHR